MSDKAECVGCGAYSSSVIADISNGHPCRFCGLPWQAAEAIRIVRAKKANDEVTGLFEAAITRAVRAEAGVAAARRLAADLRDALDEFDRAISGDPKETRE